MKKILLTLLIVISLTSYSQIGYPEMNGLPHLTIGKTSIKLFDTLFACKCIKSYTVYYREKHIPFEYDDVDDYDTTFITDCGCSDLYDSHFTKRATIIALDTVRIRLRDGSDTCFKFDFIELTFLDDTLAQIVFPLGDSTIDYLSLLYDYPVTTTFYVKHRYKKQADKHTIHEWINSNDPDISGSIEIIEETLMNGAVIKQNNDFRILSKKRMTKICELDTKIIKRKLRIRKFFKRPFKSILGIN